ncbi:tetratricopeptide repeat protein 31, partial [Discoglossus pictus]
MEPGGSQPSCVQRRNGGEEDIIDIGQCIKYYDFNESQIGLITRNVSLQERDVDSDDGRYVDDYSYYNDDDEDDRSWDGGSVPGTYCGLRPSFLCQPNLDIRLPLPTVITQEEADRNAQELLDQEQNEKEKADRKKLKKKRKKDRKRQQKIQEGKSSQSEGNQVCTPLSTDCIQNSDTSKLSPPDVEGAQEDPKEDPVESNSEDDLDLASTFVRQAQKKMENKPKPERKTSREDSSGGSQERASDRSKERESDRGEEAAPVRVPAQEIPKEKLYVTDQFQIQQSLDLATIGNHKAACERFMEAIGYYTDAIRLNPLEHRFLGNRSYCYERSGCYAEALQDAERSLQLQPQFIKGLFRKGKALKGLQRYSEAITAFHRVLLVDANHTEAAVEITRCQQLVHVVKDSSLVITNSTRGPLLPTPGLLTPTNNTFVSRRVGYTRAQENMPGTHPNVTVKQPPKPSNG